MATGAERVEVDAAAAPAPRQEARTVHRRKKAPEQVLNGATRDTGDMGAVPNGVEGVRVANARAEIEKRIAGTDETTESVLTTETGRIPKSSPRRYGAIVSDEQRVKEDDPDIAPAPDAVEDQPVSKTPLKNDTYFLTWPDWLDDSMRSFDDDLIKLCQWKTTGYVYAFSWFFTALTSVEAALPLPFVLFCLGYDVAGTVMVTILTVLGFLSQLPKRFLWRTRPWMNGRAKTVRRDRTSSFPSRGVICGIVFPISCLMAYEMETGRRVSSLLYMGLTSLSVVCTSFARVNVGAHYPSDTIAGVFMGLAVQRMGTLSLGVWDVFGSPITDDGMYALSSEAFIERGDLLKRSSWGALVAAVSLSYIVTLVSMRGFWQKCNYVFGLLFSCLTFRFVYLNPSLTASGFSVAPLAVEGLRPHLKVFLISCLLLGYGMKTRGKKGAWRIANFVLLYHLSLMLLLWYRLRRADEL